MKIRIQPLNFADPKTTSLVPPHQGSFRESQDWRDPKNSAESTTSIEFLAEFNT